MRWTPESDAELARLTEELCFDWAAVAAALDASLSPDDVRLRWAALCGGPADGGDDDGELDLDIASDSDDGAEGAVNGLLSVAAAASEGTPGVEFRAKVFHGCMWGGVVTLCFLCFCVSVFLCSCASVSFCRVFAARLTRLLCVSPFL